MKKCTLYVVRHGETEWNRKGKVQGHSDIPLTPEGEAQAHAKAEHFRDIHFSHVASSDLMRAQKTAEILAKNRGLSLVTSPALREQSWGPWEGEKFDNIREKFGPFNVDTGDEPHVVPGVESYGQVVKRVEGFLCDVAMKHLGSNILVVTHGGVMKGLIYRLGLSQYFNRYFDNLGHLQLESDGSGLHFVHGDGLKGYKE